MKNVVRMVMFLTASFAGGLVGSLLLQPGILLAAGTSKQQSNTREFIDFYNQAGKRTGYLGVGQSGQGTMFLFNSEGKISLQMGSYSGKSELGQSLFALHDREQRLRLLLRLDGPEDSPTIVLKDKFGRDKVVLGLDRFGEVPFLHYVDKHGAVKNVFP